MEFATEQSGYDKTVLSDLGRATPFDERTFDDALKPALAPLTFFGNPKCLKDGRESRKPGG